MLQGTLVSSMVGEIFAPWILLRYRLARQNNETLGYGFSPTAENICRSLFRRRCKWRVTSYYLRLEKNVSTTRLKHFSLSPAGGAIPSEFELRCLGIERHDCETVGLRHRQSSQTYDRTQISDFCVGFLDRGSLSRIRGSRQSCSRLGLGARPSRRRAVQSHRNGALSVVQQGREHSGFRWVLR